MHGVEMAEQKQLIAGREELNIVSNAIVKKLTTNSLT
jgi:hypothetical protein